MQVYSGNNQLLEVSDSRLKVVQENELEISKWNISSSN
jgi:hypothetical protein